MKLKKLVTGLAAAALLIPAVIGLGSVPVKAAPANGNIAVTMHKLVYPEGTDLGDHNSIDEYGAERTDLPTGAEALKDVSFTAWDITDEYQELLAKGSGADLAANADAKAIQSFLQNKYKATSPDIADALETVTTDGSGTAAFAELAKLDSEGNSKAYLFLETKTPANVKQIALPMIVITPAYGADGMTEVTDIHLYPKNEQFDKLIEKSGVHKEADRELGTNATTHETQYNVIPGDVLEYQLKVVIPLQGKLTVSDEPKDGLTYRGHEDGHGTEKIAISGLTEKTDYEVATGEPARGFTIVFKDTPAVQALRGSIIPINYEMVVTKEAPVYAWFNNEALYSVTNGDLTTTDSDKGPDLITGAHDLEKIDSVTKKKLNGAKFRLVQVDTTKNNAIVAYATGTADEISFVPEESSAVDFEVKNGELSFTGLLFSEKLANGISYAFVEVAAPQGYVLSQAVHTFTVAEGEATTVIATTTVENIKRGLLPSTGGNGIYMFVIAGAALMAGALIWHRKAKKASTEV